MFFKELEAGMLALNIRIDNMQRDINTILKLLQESKAELALKNSEPEPFKTKEGLFNYKHRKPKQKE